jgi:hypothetical protein
MFLKIFKWLNKRYPQNYIIRRPFIGTLIYMAFCLGFVILYKPLNVRAARFFSLDFTMVLYFSALTLPVFFIIKGLKKIRYFSNPAEWTFLKELLAFFMILLGMGIAVYFLGFLVELPAQRWNWATFIDSCLRIFLIGIFPFAFFTVLNYQYLFVTDIVRNFNHDPDSSSPEPSEALIRINSQLKKEELNFYPSQFIYAESDGNYVIFHLYIDKQIRKKIIRNSISNIEKQLQVIPFFFRTHRAFIVNIKQVDTQKGNRLGYRLKMHGTDTLIPVSRQTTRNFDLLLKRLR